MKDRSYKRCGQCGQIILPEESECPHCSAAQNTTRVWIDTRSSPPSVKSTDQTGGPHRDSQWEGKLFDNIYKVRKAIGFGGMSTIYLAQQNQMWMKRNVALKIYHSGTLSAQHIDTHFRKEASAASQLGHPHIVSVYDIGVTREGFRYLAMEYVKGFSLKQQMDSNGVFQWQTACTVAFQMAKALQHVHEKGFIHGDVKPENIILSIAEKGNQPYAKLHDFGTSQTVEEVMLFSPPVTESGIVEVVGTPEFMAPEQFKGASSDRRSDIYSLGKVLQSMLIGRDTTISGRHRDSFVMNQTVNPTKSRFSKQPPAKECLGQISIPNVLKLLLTSMLEEDAAERPQSVDQVIDVLRSLMRGVSRTPMTMINLKSSRKSDDQTISYKS